MSLSRSNEKRCGDGFERASFPNASRRGSVLPRSIDSPNTSSSDGRKAVTTPRGSSRKSAFRAIEEAAAWWPGMWRDGRRCVGAKKIVRLHRFFLHQISLESKLNGRHKVKGGNGSISCLNLYVAHCLAHHPEPRSGLCPELLADFRIPNLLGARRGAEGSFLCSPSSRFSGTGGGLGSLPRASRASWGGRQRRCALPKPAP